MLKYLRWLLLPFSWPYALVIIIRNLCYDAGLFKSQGFDIPVISVGNLDVGGAGKSPMTEYLIRLLKGDHKLATLSRGYGRKTQGFLTASATATATESGDEPAQFKHKFPDITVAVCEKRVAGIEHLKDNHDLIILDDAYQHRAVKPGLNILLFDYSRIFEPHFLLPAGNLREPFAGRKRADAIVVTKCPMDLTDIRKERIKTRIKPFAGQQLFFAGISYTALHGLNGDKSNRVIDDETTVFLLSGIANPKPLVNHLQKQAKQLIHHNYPDHHPYTLKNITKLADGFKACSAQKKLVITTEKDAQRLGEQALQTIVKQLDILVLPIQVEFLENGQQFDQIIKNYVREHTTYNKLY
ncbi:tetraacyldisaccharide 4'-kinase [Mucilaginibacter sp. PPCGB 2223]|uniref:tetraacyldisaccharide 4'-kinase n=1 Tax=Mucilaginibacter sp. PPCGB 2223 TaxID=1886027 RepID=UPI0008249D38|nr:tetraacyldisaccharide 4'-kinase [Mucilaginibacter sp. PPCGB 2223]OCX51749.1 tetraacyldisaccharide 4'-kinase [Mucilaginibacter sp. PPCGB 2223]